MLNLDKIVSDIEMKEILYKMCGYKLMKHNVRTFYFIDKDKEAYYKKVSKLNSNI